MGCSIGGLGAQPLLGYGSHSSILAPTDLNFLSPGLYNNLTSTYFLRASHLYSIQPVDGQGYPLIPGYLRPDAPVICTGAFLILTARTGRRSICNNVYYIWSISLCFSISLDSKVPGNSSWWGFCDWFWFLLITFFAIQYSIVLTYFPVRK